jgi:hypothetical protein
MCFPLYSSLACVPLVLNFESPHLTTHVHRTAVRDDYVDLLAHYLLSLPVYPISFPSLTLDDIPVSQPLS